METRANYIVTGAFTLAVIVGVFGFIFWFRNTAGGGERSSYRVVSSSTEVQKQVGQTSVQLPQVRQRSAVSAKRGWSRLAREQVAQVNRLERAAHLGLGVARHLRRRVEVGRRRPHAAERSASTSAPRLVPASARKRCPPSSSSVSTRS